MLLHLGGSVAAACIQVRAQTTANPQSPEPYTCEQVARLSFGRAWRANDGSLNLCTCLASGRVSKNLSKAWHEGRACLFHTQGCIWRPNLYILPGCVQRLMTQCKEGLPVARPYSYPQETIRSAKAKQDPTHSSNDFQHLSS